MKVVWLCNAILGPIGKALGRQGGGLWMDHVFADLRDQENVTIQVFCPGPEQSGQLDGKTQYILFHEGVPQRYLSELEQRFTRQLREFQPDVIHIWGTEYGHTLAMVNAAKALGLEKKIVISIQGLCGVYAGHYREGVPESVFRGFTFRDLVRWDNPAIQQKKFVLRGELENKALEGISHVIGRTDWDRACTSQINPQAQYHFCNETLRDVFYQGRWQYSVCKRHTIFASSCMYPIKGFHYLLEALLIVKKRYPDAQIAVAGKPYYAHTLSEKLRQESYQRYLEKMTCRYDLLDSIVFLGSLSAEQMKQAYLEANVFVLPSTVENSPNSLGEAMLLGVPCVAADVGGVRNLMHEGEGRVYPSTAPYMLAHEIMEVFALEDQAEQIGAAASTHARKTHDPEKNLRDLLHIYQTITVQN